MRTARVARFAATALLVGVCAWPAAAGLFKIGVSREKKVGAEAAAQIEAGRGVIVLRGPAADLIEEIGQQLVNASAQKDFDFHFGLLDLEARGEREKLINAFALPGGFIYVFKDMQEAVRTEDQLAAVLAHEIIHVTDHHWARQQSSDWERTLLLALGLGISGAGRSVANAADLANFSLTARFSRKYEQQSDDEGITLMAKAGFNPRGMVEMLEGLAKLTKDQPKLLAWMSDHPTLKARVERAQRHAAEVSGVKPQAPTTSPLETYARPTKK